MYVETGNLKKQNNYLIDHPHSCLNFIHIKNYNIHDFYFDKTKNIHVY